MPRPFILYDKPFERKTARLILAVSNVGVSVCDSHELELSEPNNAYWRLSLPVVIEIRSVAREIQKAEGHNPVF